MTRRMIVSVAVLLVIVAITVIAQDATGPDPLPKGPGKDEVVAICGSCHDVDAAIGTRRTNAEWRGIVDAMINRGAQGSDEDFKAVTQYLSKYFGLTNVNTATAKEIQEALEIPSSGAEATSVTVLNTERLNRSRA